MSAAAEAHEGRIFIVPDAHGYAAGRSSECTCGWQSHELREREGQALIDHFQHLTEIGIRPKERTA